MGAARQRISHKSISTEENEKTSERSQATPTTSHHSMSKTSRKTPSSSAFTVSERTTDPEYDVIEKSDSAAETVAVPQPQSLQQTNQLQHPISDETIRCHADRLTNFEVLRHIKGPSRVWKRSSDSVLDASWVRKNLLRDPVQVPSSLVCVFVDESVKTLLLHLLSLNSASTRAGSKGQDRHSDKSAGSQCAITGAESRLTKALTDSQSRIEDPLLLLVDSEQTKPERSQDVSPLDFKSPAVSPTTSSRAGSTMAKETLDNHIISSKDYETYSSSSSPLNDHRSSDPNPVAVKKSSRGFHFILCKKAPVFSPGVKKSSKVCPAGMMSDHHQSTSSSGNLQKSEQRESAFRKTRKRLSRIFTAIRKALPNPFQCMTPPS
ncbi:uncharacterized protein LOC118821459 [Colossoma macropomum]|uniref:uncharacterized protein LOC118821459 n=1 Tax=Colossoma macropomum TaxID=42526 RepID=UPI0018653B70|nr:uncharacterized protein LOC118821459 [Colossoma macropomum]